MDGQTPDRQRPRFAHLHLHSEYSLLDGGNKITPLIDRVKELGMDAVALTDHGNLFGALEFYTKARAAGIKPILGIEAYVAHRDRTDRTPGTGKQPSHHLVLLAENLTGWQNLLKLSSDAYLTGFYYRPRMDKSTLEDHCDGLIAINGHLGSSLAYHLVRYERTNAQEDWDAAVEEARWHAKTFKPCPDGKPRFYVELQMHDVLEQQRINPHLKRLARELDLPLICDNDVHYLRAEDYDTHDSLCCISMSKSKDDASRMRYSRDLYLKSPAQMAELFPDCPEAIENTLDVADRCNVELDLDSNHAPLVRIESPGDPPAYESGNLTEWFKDYCARFELVPFDGSVKEGETQDDIKDACDRSLRQLCEAGLVWRYGNDGITDAHRARLDRELQILADKLISAYFLIVWDFVDWARQRGIPANARGSGVGTMVGYVLGLSNACPVEYGLLFERFTDPDRTEYPDIDIDICQDGRADVINYVREKYGHVAQIITFGRLKARAALKDVARVNGLAAIEGQRLANLVPAELNIRIEDALEKEPNFRNEYDTNPLARSVIDTARALEDHARHAGVHAAGVVVATQPLDNFVPLCKVGSNDEAVTQWDGPTCERVGLLKMDFLGLRTLSTIERAKDLIRRTLDEETIWAAVGREPGSGDHPLDLDRLHYDNQQVLDLFRRGDTSGIFQFESGGMRGLLTQMKPDRLEDLIAANALYRPGPMELIPDYCARKHGEEAVPEAHEIVAKYTEETYGIMVYQEQVMQIVHGLGDIPLRAAYSLIKAISKKKVSVIDALRPKFIEGAGAKGVTKAHAEELFDLILKFAGYGFNKSHSTGYAIIAYQTAYLKTFFPCQYMAAVLTFESSAKKVDDWAPYLVDCKKTIFPDSTAEKPHVGIDVHPPDINRSDAEFSVVFDDEEPRDPVHGHIRFGLGAIRGIGLGAIESITSEREKSGPFKSIFDFCERISTRTLNKSSIEGLVKCGAFDSVHGLEKRAAAFAAIEGAVAAGQRAAEDKAAGQLSMFAGGAAAEEGGAEATQQPLPGAEPWDQRAMLDFEKEVLGFHVSGHPLDKYEDLLRTYATATTVEAAEAANESVAIVGGTLTRVRLIVTNKGRSAGQRMAMVTLQDANGAIDGVVFANVFARCGERLQTDCVVLMTGRVDTTRGDPQIIVDNVIPIESAEQHLAGQIEVNLFDTHGADRLEEQIQLISGVIDRARGGRVVGQGSPADVILNLHVDGRRVSLKAPRLKAVPEPGIMGQLREISGIDGVCTERRRLSEIVAPRERRWQPKSDN